MRLDIHLHVHHYIKDIDLMAISAAFQAQLDRLAAYVAALPVDPADGSASAQDAEDTAALSTALDTLGAPPVATAP